MAEPLGKVVTVARTERGAVRVYVGEVEIVILEYREELSGRAHHVTLVIPGGIVNFKGEGD